MHSQTKTKWKGCQRRQVISCTLPSIESTSPWLGLCPLQSAMNSSLFPCWCSIPQLTISATSWQHPFIYFSLQHDRQPFESTWPSIISCARHFYWIINGWHSTSGWYTWWQQWCILHPDFAIIWVHDRDKLADSLGYSYGVKEQNDRHTIWRCSVHNKKTYCLATVWQEGDNSTHGPHPHLHPAEPGVATTIKTRKKINQQSLANMLQSAYEITDQVLAEDVTEEPTPGLPSKAQLAQNAELPLSAVPASKGSNNYQLWSARGCHSSRVLPWKHQNQEQPQPPVCKWQNNWHSFTSKALVYWWNF